VRPAANGLLAAVIAVGVAQAAGASVGFRPITLQVTPIETFARASSGERFGALTFRGGVELASQDSDFGALSGLDFTPDGSLLAVADTGFWFAARPVERDGRLIGLADARLAPILDDKGRPVRGKLTGDAEALRVTDVGGRPAAVVAFEGRNDVRRFVAAPDFDTATARAVRLPPSATGLERNAGIEALAIAPDNGPLSGAMVLVAERSLNGDGNHRGWIVGGHRAGEFSVVRSDGFDVTDAAFLPQGDLLVLERRLTLLAGAGMRIRRIAAADLLPGATVDGRVLIEAGIGNQIDNMEGMALRPGAGGDTLIMLVSDDNKNFVQRTILLQFALPADAVPIPRMRADLR
jgi:hypothetical protein